MLAKAGQANATSISATGAALKAAMVKQVRAPRKKGRKESLDSA